MASSSRPRLFFLLCAILIAAGVGASAQDLQSPYWSLTFDDYGYTDWVTMTYPGTTAHEVLCGDWAAAVKYDGIPTSGGKSMWLTPYFSRPDFATNSTFRVMEPMTTWDNPANSLSGPDTGRSRIRNSKLSIEILVEMRPVIGGMAVGMNPGGVGAEEPIRSFPYVVFQTYKITNTSGAPLSNFTFFQMLHSHPNDDWFANNYGVYDPTPYPEGAYPEYRHDIATFGGSLWTPAGSDVIGFSASSSPAAYGLGTFGGHSDEPTTGLIRDIYLDSLHNNTFAGPSEISGAMKWCWRSIPAGQTVTVTVCFWAARAVENLEPPPGAASLLQAYEGSSRGASGHHMGYKGIVGDTVSAVPGVFSIVHGENWANFVGAAQAGVPYTLKNVTLTKQTPAVVQCADVFPVHRVAQQGTNSIRTWWPLLYEVPLTVWTLTITYGTPVAWDDDGLGPHQASYVHTETWQWYVDATLESMKTLVRLFHELPFGTDEVPLISDEVLYPQLISKLDTVTANRVAGDMAGVGLLLGEFEMQVMDACIATSPAKPYPTGPGTGIANSAEHPACCKLLADAEYVGRSLGVFTTAK